MEPSPGRLHIEEPARRAVQAAASRTRGEASASRRSSAGSAEPPAIRCCPAHRRRCRTGRGRWIASTPRRRARRGRPEAVRSSARGSEGRFAGALRELVPGAGGETIVAAIDAIAEQRPQRLMNDRASCSMIGDAAPRIEPVGRGESLGRAGHRGRHGIGRNGRLRRRRRAARPRAAARPGTARSRTGATPSWCACPASRARRKPARQAFPSAAVSTNTLSSWR